MDDKSPLKQIRTFQGDVAEALKKENASLVSIQRSEQVKKAKEEVSHPPAPQSQDKKNNLLILLSGSIILLGMGGLATWYSYDQYEKKSQTPIALPPQGRFISSEESVNIDLSRLNRNTLISSILDNSKGVGELKVKHLVLRNGSYSSAPTASSSLFLSTLSVQAPGSLVRALGGDFMIGTLGNSRFIIFKVNSFENAFPGMLEWEKNMAQDIGPLFSTYENVKYIPDPSVFRDITSRNKNARVLSLAESPVLLYSFFNNQMLIITDNMETLKTLINRLNAQILTR